MFISAAKLHGEPSLRLMEGYTVRDERGTYSQSKQVLYLGPLSKYDDGKPDYVQRLRDSFKSGEPLIPELKPYVTPDEVEDYSEYVKLQNISDFILEPMFEQLGIGDVLREAKSESKTKYDLVGLTKLLTYERILQPASKLATFSNNSRYLNPPAKSGNIQDIYKALDVLNKHSQKIQARMNTKISNGITKRNTSHVFYDVTNYYYETQYNDEDVTVEVDGQKVVIREGARKRGVSKENRNQPLTQMGLFIDDKGIPISFKTFPGNHIDQTTMRPTMRESIDNYDLGRVIVVADRGLHSGKNIAHLVKNGNGYVISKSIKKSTKEVREWVKNPNKYYDGNSNLVGADDDVNFKVKSRTVEVTVRDDEDKEYVFMEKQVAYWSKAHYLREAQQNKKFMEYLDSVIAFPDKIKDRQSKAEYFLKTTTIDRATGKIVKVKNIREVDIKKVQEFVDLMGYYLITTSETKMPNAKVINTYHGLSRIEDSFRITKSDLEGRPVHVRLEQHIHAHFLVCFIALTIIRLLQHKALKHYNIGSKVKTKKNKDEKWWESGITARDLAKALNTWSVDHVNKYRYKFNEPTDTMQKLGEILGVDLFPTKPSQQDINKLKKGLQKVKFV
jgi:transposase